MCTINTYTHTHKHTHALCQTTICLFFLSGMKTHWNNVIMLCQKGKSAGDGICRVRGIPRQQRKCARVGAVYWSFPPPFSLICRSLLQDARYTPDGICTCANAFKTKRIPIQLLHHFSVCIKSCFKRSE